MIDCPVTSDIVSGSKSAGGKGIVGDDVDRKALGPQRRFFTNAPQTYNADRLAANIHAALATPSPSRP